MRIGYNPLRNELHKPSDFKHQVIIPVYLPNAEGYFKDGLRILDYCLQSLFKTAHSKTFITIINNGSTAEVAAAPPAVKKSSGRKVFHKKVLTSVNQYIQDQDCLF